ncbi:pyruvate dehydrogenase (acetyl-transferring) kinase, mitochondrial [Hyposmocoma kahamanoa]|uniref:pyruvate dehydrogenase (acetyl-transferring) kinase, mitochondrial n=1 Tax=Hyposmocoma kahamanoa TaxID=1477025 RepID=UPI000E6D5B17|nr:pyruvate dehydrogenase (acetyl-transferring) kinase, mitochondrial [Hyposmocoma kahamanoa]
MRLAGAIFSNVTKMLDFYSQFNPSPLSIKQFIDFGLNACEKKSFIFLRKELPVRLANIMKEIALLPENLLRMPSVGLVNQWYERSFEEIIQFEKMEPEPPVLSKFCERLAHIRNRHADVVQTMAQGVLELKESHEVDSGTEVSIQYFLDRFYMSRISIRMLINQHTLLFGEQVGVGKQASVNGMGNGGRHIGSIDPACDVVAVVRDAYENARFLCDRYYLAAPDLEILQKGGELFETQDSSYPIDGIDYTTDYLPNSHHQPIMNNIKKVARLNWTQVAQNRKKWQKLTKVYSDVCYVFFIKKNISLPGYGYGLPISRLYARYFHGDLILMSCEGYGTDAVIYLKALSNEANELLPVFNRSTSKFYRPVPQLADWSGTPNTTGSAQTRSKEKRKPVSHSL